MSDTYNEGQDHIIDFETERKDGEGEICYEQDKVSCIAGSS